MNLQLAGTSIAVGDTAPVEKFGPITRTDIVRYAGASGDFNPIHHDEEFARSAGYPTVFSVGMFQAALMASFASRWLGPRNIRRYAVRFIDQVWPGDELTFTGEVTGVQAAPQGVEVSVTLTCTRQTETVAVAGSASFLLPTEEQ